MEPLLRAFFMYVFLMVIVRISGKRTLAEVTTFDFVLLLVIGEAAQQGITGDDFSVTNAVVIITAMVFFDIMLSLVKERSFLMEKWMDGTPELLVSDGKVLKDRLRRARVDEFDILEAARKLRGIERMEEIRYAVLEKDGGISIIPRRKGSPP